MKFAAIDIGSNSAKLLIMQVYEREGHTSFVKEALFKVSLKLGEDSFKGGQLSEMRCQDLLDTMDAFAHLIKVYKPIRYKAYATSAMRDLKDGEEILKKIEKRSGLKLKIISGHQEADTLLTAYLGSIHPESSKDYLFIDVGGGSTELCTYSHGQLIHRKSFNLGALRLKNDLVSEKTWVALDLWLKEIQEKYPDIVIAGTGGSINSIYKYFAESKNPVISQQLITQTYNRLKDLSSEERVIQYGLKPLRAEVIPSACEIFMYILDKLKKDKIWVPKVGLADGMIFRMYHKHKQRKISE